MNQIYKQSRPVAARRLSENENAYPHHNIKGESGSVTVYSNGRPCGYVRADCTFYRKIGTNQILRDPPALALTEEVIRQLKKAGCEKIQVTTEDAIYRVSLDDFLMDSFELDRGYGLQRALILAKWQVEHPGQAKQLTLLGVMQ